MNKNPGGVAATFAGTYEAGDAWLATCSAHPVLVRAAWEDELLAPIASGIGWLVAETQLVFGMPALARIREADRSPVLADPESDTAWWLVPLDAAEDLDDARHVKVHAPGWLLRCPPTGWQVDGRFWLARPDGSGRLTDPTVLAAAFGPGGGARLSSEAPA
ncbi:hypothetical protein BN159_5995 [Streptomyces davaonensis JCM 4913]|uniref:Uncharacterized protein n=1 Tax=Streptomyces davaonensis (strain DSM 101723 / JCM 4913 / KCC S-0913 / 768) TaxID=1214101 RepID=K4RC24_STRDJ|nr:hypothetical protein [Streptomyces davaonensis]CCK30374.1 hypothetical protein BN159_5995 [Streptomyces davaonensis JCM 4913]